MKNKLSFPLGAGRAANAFIVLLALCLTTLSSCSKDEVIDEPTSQELELSSLRLEFDRIHSSQTVDVTTNQSGVTCQSNADWCTATYSDGKINVEVTTNQQTTDRTSSVSVKAGTLSRSITVSQKGLNSYSNDIVNDIKLTISSAETSSFQSANSNIEKSYDGDYSTNYHSNWSNTASDYFPIELIYNLADCPSMDYMVYYPRQSGTNGNIKEFELWVSTQDNPTMTKYGDYNFEGSSSASILYFSPALVKPTSVKLVVKSGTGDRQGFVACAEMEFYQKNPDSFDYLTIFTDNSCSELKSGISKADIDAIENGLFRDLANEIYNNEYDMEFRVQDYLAWQHPDIMASTNKTSAYSLRDNPTGIFVSSGEKLIFFANNPNNERVSIIVQDLNNGYGGNSYPVANGMNSIDISSGGLIYVMYHSDNANKESVKINFVTGTVNGYFDSQKHKAEDWERILSNASYKRFDLLGKYAHLTFPTENFKNSTPDGMSLINKYDEMVQLEWEFMGLVKYNKTFKNRAYFHVTYSADAHMYATSYRTAYAVGTMDLMCNLDRFSSDVWGPAHELGHVNQTRPGLKWAGMTEVTNNIHSLYIQTTFGNTSRLTANNQYSVAVTEIVNAHIAHNASTNVFNKLVPFWQLKLYLMDALGKDDFYKDLYEEMRNKEYTNVQNDGYYQLDFVRTVCKIANLDLTDFFEAWGFFTPIDMEINDYSASQFTITQQEIDTLKAEIAAKGYPAPAHNDIYDITDNNVANYR